MKINWYKAAKTLGIVGAIGTGCTVVSGIIKAVKPEARDLPSDHVEQIKKLVADTMAEKQKES